MCARQKHPLFDRTLGDCGEAEFQGRSLSEVYILVCIECQTCLGLVLVCGLKGLPQLEGPPNIDISIFYRIFRLYIEYEYTVDWAGQNGEKR